MFAQKTVIPGKLYDKIDAISVLKVLLKKIFDLFVLKSFDLIKLIENLHFYTPKRQYLKIN